MTRLDPKDRTNELLDAALVLAERTGWRSLTHAAVAQAAGVSNGLVVARLGTKTHTVRDVDLVPQAIEALKAMRPFTELKRDEAGAEVDIFENPVTGRAWHDERSQRDHYWKPTLKRLGIRERRAYCTRHTWCTVALMAGVNPAYIADQAGHSMQMLLQVYARWIPGADGGSQKRLLAQAMTRIPQESPRAAGE